MIQLHTHKQSIPCLHRKKNTVIFNLFISCRIVIKTTKILSLTLNIIHNKLFNRYNHLNCDKKYSDIFNLDENRVKPRKIFPAILIPKKNAIHGLR